MSGSQYKEFDDRMRRISRRHSKLSRGYVTSVNGDGLVVAKPRRKLHKGTLRSVAMIVVVLMVFKCFLHAYLGAAEYDARVEALAEGSFIEKAGAYFMVSDPLTEMASKRIAHYL